MNLIMAVGQMIQNGYTKKMGLTCAKVTVENGEKQITLVSVLAIVTVLTTSHKITVGRSSWQRYRQVKPVSFPRIPH